jgi:hypothetical protein
MRILAQCFFGSSLFLATHSISVELSEIIIGGTYYHDEWNNNNKAKVVAIRGDRVEIVYLEGDRAGEVDRVSASDLLTRTESREEAMEDVAEGATVAIVAVAAFVCLVDPDSCKQEQEQVETKPQTTLNYRNIYFQNDCGIQASLSITYLNQKTEWITMGWWNIPAYEGRFLADGNNNYIALSSEHFYYYAETPKAELLWNGSDYNANITNRTIGMRKTYAGIDSANNYTYKINCDESDPNKGKYLIGFNGQKLDHFLYNNQRFEYGVQVDSVIPGMPASSKLISGDIIYQVDEQQVHSIESLFTYINGRSEPAAPVTIAYIREGQIYSVSITPQKKI